MADRAVQRFGPGSADDIEDPVSRGLGIIVMLALARTTPNFLRNIAPWLYLAGILLLLVVVVMATSARERSAGSIWA